VTNKLMAVVMFFLLAAAAAQAAPPSLDNPLPTLAIADKGEMLLENDEYSYRPWSSVDIPDRVHVLQYFAGTTSASKTFEPFTDLLQVEIPQRGIHVTTVVNLDAALWGTSGFVINEVKASKQEFPDSTMVLDKEGVGEETWELGKKGAVLAVMDKQGKVVYLSNQALSEQEVAATLALVKELIDS